MEPAPVVHPADIKLASNGSGRLVLALDFPEHVVRLFVDDLLSMATKCSVYRLPVGLFVGFVVLQVQAYQVRVLVPLHNEKSFSWLEQCLSKGSVSCTFTGDDAREDLQFEVHADFPALRPGDLAQMRRFSCPVPEDVLLVIASSVPSMADLSAVASLSFEAAVDAVSVCIVRDFFNTDGCVLATAELMRSFREGTQSGHLGDMRDKRK